MTGVSILFITVITACENVIIAQQMDAHHYPLFIFL